MYKRHPFQLRLESLQNTLKMKDYSYCLELINIPLLILLAFFLCCFIVAFVQYLYLTYDIYKMEKEELRKNITALNLLIGDERLKNM